MSEHSLLKGVWQMTEKGKRRVRRSEEERRGQVLQAAAKLFGERGFARATTRDIAREAGISEGTIYRYFTSKQDLLFSFIESTALAPLRAQLTEPGEGGDESEVLRRLFEERFSLAERHRSLMKVAIGEALFDPELARAFAQHVARPGVALLRSFLRERIRRGRFRNVDPDIVARALMGSFLGFAVLWPVLLPQKRKQTSRRLAAALTSLFLDGLRAAERRGSAR